MTKNATDRNEWVDYGKGIAILLVIFAHVVHTYNIAYQGTSGIASQSLSTRVAYIASLHLFYFLSGLFALKLRERKFMDVLLSKVRLIFVPYLIWAVILGILKIFFSSNVMNKMQWSDLLYVIVQPIGVTWFLYVLFWGYIIYKILSYKLSMPFIVLLAVILYAISPFVEIDILSRFLHFFPFFILGVASSSWILGHNSKKYFNVWIALSVFVFLLFTVNLVNMQLYNVALIALSSIYLIISISLVLDEKKALKTLRNFGYISLIIYLFHMIPLTAFRVILLNYLNLTNIYYYTIVQIILIIISCVMFNEITNRMGVRKYLFGR